MTITDKKEWFRKIDDLLNDLENLALNKEDITRRDKSVFSFIAHIFEPRYKCIQEMRIASNRIEDAIHDIHNHYKYDPKDII